MLQLTRAWLNFNDAICALSGLPGRDGEVCGPWEGLVPCRGCYQKSLTSLMWKILGKCKYCQYKQVRIKTRSGFGEWGFMWVTRWV